MGRGHTRGVSVALHLLQCLYHLHKTEYFSSVIGRNHLEAIQMGCTGFDKDGYCQREGTISCPIFSLSGAGTSVVLSFKITVKLKILNLASGASQIDTEKEL